MPSDDEIERYAEDLRIRESRCLTEELDKSYLRLRTLSEEERINSKEIKDRDRDFEELALVRRKIGALEEEIGRRKKNSAWPW